MKKLLAHFYFAKPFRPDIFRRMALLFLIAVAAIACGNSSIGSKNDANANATPEMTSLERDIKSLKTANLEYIFVIRRKDGGVFEKEDKSYLRENLPAETNRVVSSDEEKAFVAGSNFPFPEENLKILRERFELEDLSEPAEKEDVGNTEKTAGNS